MTDETHMLQQQISEMHEMLRDQGERLARVETTVDATLDQATRTNGTVARHATQIAILETHERSRSEMCRSHADDLRQIKDAVSQNAVDHAADRASSGSALHTLERLATLAALLVSIAALVFRR